MAIFAVGLLSYPSLSSYQYRSPDNLLKSYGITDLTASEVQSFTRSLERFALLISSDAPGALIFVDSLQAKTANGQLSTLYEFWKVKALEATSEYHKADTQIKKLIKTDIAAPFQGDIQVLQGRIYKLLENYERALASFRKAEELFEELKDIEGQIITYVNLGEFYRATARFDYAIASLRKARTLSTSTKVPTHLSIYMYNRFAAVFNETGHLDSAKFFTKKNLAFARVANNPFMLASSKNELASILEKQGETDAALKLYLQAINTWMEIGQTRYWASAITNVIQLYVKNGKYEEALRWINLGLPQAEENEWYGVLYAYYYQLALIAYHTGQHEDVLRYKDLSVEAARSDFKNLMNRELAIQQSELEMDQINDQLQTSLALAKRESHLKWQAIVIAALLVLAVAVITVFLLVIREKNKDIKAALGQNQTLLKEIHHRVKNNLQVIGSLLYLQSRRTNDKNLIKILEEGQGRVRSMALIHQKLYENKDLKSIPFGQYLEEMISEIKSYFGEEVQKVKIDIQASEVHFDVEQAVPLGLIVNELCTNAFKYAFKDLGAGEFKISLQEIKKGEYHLTISDNGPGIPKEIIKGSPKSLGLKLVHILSKQLNAKAEFGSCPGMNFQLRFTV